MRVTYRHSENKEYWTQRWTAIPADEPMTNANAYPLKFALQTVVSKQQKILEAGCGAGRVLRFYHNQGFDIVGMDFIPEAIEKLKKVDSSLKVEVGDITRLQYAEKSFDIVLAFGLYHNLEQGLEEAIQETFRILRSGGKVCASFRADNIQTRLTDWLTDRREKQAGKWSERRSFHKLNLSRGEFAEKFQKAGFEVEYVYPVENMPILYKFKFFRAPEHKLFNESLGRKEGYQLSLLGNVIQKALVTLAPSQFCNIFVLIARKP